jgi:hypothetical protein
LFAAHAIFMLFLAACGATIPKAEIERCRLGVADGNDGFVVRQGAACRRVAARLANDAKPSEAMGFARKACELEDAPGCDQYLALVRAQPALPPDELSNARSAGEKACAGMVVGSDGADSRPAICVRTAELYQDIEPTSVADAGRLYGRACKLGDERSCARAKALGVDPEEHPAAAKVPTLTPSSAPHVRAIATAIATGSAPIAPPCHEMRACVAFDVNQRNTSEVVASIANRCDRKVVCIWCPVNGDAVSKANCHTATLAPSESRAGREQGLWYEGFRAIAYDCMDADDDKACLGP